MRLLSYRHAGSDRYGAVQGDGVVDLNARVGDRWPTLKSALESEALDDLAQAIAGTSADHALAEIAFDLPIPRPDKIFCAGRNYRAYHEVVESGDAPAYPSIFSRLASSFAPHGEAILKPRIADSLDYEGELVAVIGRRGRYIDAAEALTHVAGYTCMNEGTVREWASRGTQNTPAKNFYRSGSIGPWLVTADEIADPGRLHITTRRNGEVVQDGGTDMMIFDLAYLIAHISQFTWLEPGDMIATGSPGGSIVESE
ncbi:MAG: fumarylacetoacetate hydrolase family protein, partial [Alphaproteobacteria bacterium]|nr:fumarylacetoacetate hydrolase family protein [Alphaproteobacteria bacterium]